MKGNARALAPPLSPARARRLLRIGVLPWVALTLLVTLQAQILAALQQRPQPFLPSLGYTAAIYSAWALLGPLLLAAAHRILAAGGARRMRAAMLAAGLPVALALHVGLFSMLYWPVYGRSFASPGAMIPYVLAANLDTGALAYAAIVAIAVQHRRRLAAVKAPPHPPASASDGLWVRTGGGRQHVALETIEWVATAGDYVEIHTAAGTILADGSLSALGAALPPAAFARVHRTAIVRLDKVRAVRRLGRGDALLELAGGATVRLSRRYRPALSGWAALG
ncbi:LytTR family transcriptional regulator [Sphingomonas gei]|uniref:LytTR family transcriptional regulator n=1 Tax=Sphingomonas gei TaxID=1395960 RepID=A0A4S1XAR6_9SPHN|nr:LytTR family DNA-binding domain-containing protein [Sphingomonas gei]TGX53201.1 LytTR family transcriptional regulator [Sphingomonas gei]